jgi:acyl carrier protein
VDPEALEKQIFSYLEEKLGIVGVGRDEPLVSNGLLDSGNLVRVATQVERLAGITIPDQDINAECFDSVAMIVAYAASKSG